MTWLNVDFVPDNRAAYAAIEIFDRHWEESERLQALADTALQYPIGSPERTRIMDEVIAGAIANDASKAAFR